MESSSESLQLNNTVASSCTTFDIDGKVEVNNNKSMVSAVPTFIHYASDPAKVVLDALRLKGYCHLNWKTNKNSKVATTKKRTKKNKNIMKSFIFLFEQLREFSVEIKPSVKEEAMEFAVEWDEKRTDLHTPEVFGYLQFLATYKLASLVDEDELLRLLLIVHGHKEAAVLSRVLGVAHKIPHLIQGLIQKKHFLETAQYVLRFELVDEFPPVPLLISHLSHSEKLAKEKYQQEQNSQSALNESEEEEVAALRSVIKCINDYGLHSHYSPHSLEHRIEELNRRRAIKQQNWRMAKRIEQRNKRRGKRIMNKFNGQKANNRVATPSSPSPAPPVPVPTPTLTPATTPVLGPQSRQQGPKKRPAPVRGPTPACCTSRSNTRPDSQQMQKRARVVAPAEAAPSAPQPTGYPSQHRAGQLTEQSKPYLRATEAHYSLGGSVPPLLHPPMSHIGWQHRPDPVAGGGTPMPFSFTNHFGAGGHLNPRPPTSAGPPYLNGSWH